MSKKNTKAIPQISQRKMQQFFIVEKGKPGRVYVAWLGDSTAPPEFNLNFIDDSIAPANCKHQVVGYHVGHEHSYGYRHRHHYSIWPVAERLDNTHEWNKCALLFINETSQELQKSYGATPSHVSVATLCEMMT